MHHTTVRRNGFFVCVLNILLECEFLISRGISFQTFVPMNFNVCPIILVIVFMIITHMSIIITAQLSSYHSAVYSYQ